MNNDSNPLLEGIIKQSKAEAAAILQKSADEIAALQETYRKKAEDARQNEEQILQVQLDKIARKEVSLMRNAQRKSELQRSDHLHGLVREKVVGKMTALLGTPGYQDVLVGWIAEAAVGLDHKEAVVRCSFKEHVTAAMLQEAERLVKDKTGKTVRLRFSEEPLSAQGVMVSSVDGKVAYNNQVATRINRYDREIQELMEVDACKVE